MSDQKLVESSMLIRGTKVPTVTREVPIKELNFYPDNPRIYSIVVIDGEKPSQADILGRLQVMEHVRQLVQDIKANGGLIDPLIVRAGDMVVLEGNSRLAAYRHLAIGGDIRWAAATCTILPADIDEKLVFALLAQYHVKGKKDWAPYEKAGFIYRRFKEQHVDLQQAAPEMGLTKDEARHLITVYEFMIDHGDRDPAHWSYYDEFLKSRKIKKARRRGRWLYGLHRQRGEVRHDWQGDGPARQAASHLRGESQDPEALHDRRPLVRRRARGRGGSRRREPGAQPAEALPQVACGEYHGGRRQGSA